MSNYTPLAERKAEYAKGVEEQTRIPLHQYLYRLKGSEPWRITNSWYTCRLHATQALQRIYGDHLVPDSTRPVVDTAAHVPPWRIWGDKSKSYVELVGDQMDVEPLAVHDEVEL